MVLLNLLLKRIAPKKTLKTIYETVHLPSQPLKAIPKMGDPAAAAAPTAAPSRPGPLDFPPRPSAPQGPRPGLGRGPRQKILLRETAARVVGPADAALDPDGVLRRSVGSLGARTLRQRGRAAQKFPRWLSAAGCHNICNRSPPKSAPKTIPKIIQKNTP